jgi:hypothetical protein
MKNPTKQLIQFCAISFFCTLALGAPRGYLASEAPVISYRTTAGADSRKLIFVNNPEVILANSAYCDVADNIEFGQKTCARSLHRLEQAVGNFRNWFEHTNGTLKPLNYAVRVHNPGPNCATIRVRGFGFSGNAVKNGGREFVSMFNNYGSTAYQLCAEKSLNIFSTNGNTTTPTNKFLAGVVDFDIEGQPLIIDNLAYFNAPASITKPIGYTQRKVLQVREGLVYKGLSLASEAVAENINFVIDDSTPIGRMPVRYPNFNLPEQHNPPTTEGFCVGTPPCQGALGSWGDYAVRDTWITHIAPVDPEENSKRMNGVVADQITLYTPEYPSGCKPMSEDRDEKCYIMSPFFKWWYGDLQTWEYPNWGNWAVHYKLRGSITNSGSRPRTVHLGVRGDGNSPIAYRGQNGVWGNFPLKKASDTNLNDYFPYSSFVVQPSESKAYWGDIILSGPAAGTLQNLVRIVD